LTYFAPDAVWDFADTGVGAYASGAEIRDVLEGWFGAFDGLAFELEEILDLGSGVTFAVVNQRARPTGSPGYVRRREASVGAWHESLITRVTTYIDIDKARAAAERLAEEGGVGGV
jgi:ketosteroid isomerase-like protein